MRRGRCAERVETVTAPKGSEDGSVLIMSANIRRKEKFFATARADVGVHRWRRRAASFLKNIALVQPDIFGTQEALPAQYKLLAKCLKGYVGVVTYRDEKEGSRSESCPIFVSENRFDLLDSGTFWLSEHPEQAYSLSWGGKECRIATFVILKDKQTGKKLAVFNAHVEWEVEKGRDHELQMLASMISEVRAAKGADEMILFGDLNTDRHLADGLNALSPIEALLKDSKTFEGMEDYGATFHGYGLKPTESIDYIYLPEKATVLEAGKVEKTYGDIYPSDHFPIYARVKL